MTSHSVLIRSTSVAVAIGFCGASAATLPQPIRAGIFLDCGGTYSAKVLFDRPFATSSVQAVGNSGFETPSIGSQSFEEIPSGTLGAWTVSQIDVVSASYMAADSGRQSIDMNMNVAGSIQQTLSTTAGQTATLALSYTYNDQCFQFKVGSIPPEYMSEVVWNGKVVDTIRVAAGSSRTWRRYSISLVTKGNDNLVVRSIVPGTCGNMLDDIAVTTTTTSSQSLGTSTATVHPFGGTSLPTISIPASKATFDALGTTATFPLGVLPASSSYSGTMGIQVSDGSGAWITESVAVDDSVGPWVDSARIAPSPLGTTTDSVYFWTSEPVTTDAPWSFLVDRLGSPSGSASTAVPATVSSVAGGSDEYLALLPAGQLRNGDSLRLNPSTTSDLHGNPALSCHRDAPLSILSGVPTRPGSPGGPANPVRVEVRTVPYAKIPNHLARPGRPVEIWVRRFGDSAWLGTDGSTISDTGHPVGAVVTTNTRVGGTAYFYDNSGVFAVSGNLAGVAAMSDKNRLPRDSSGTYQIRIAWDGRLDDGAFAASGIYVVRLVLLYHTPDSPKTKIVNKVFRVGIDGLRR